MSHASAPAGTAATAPSRPRRAQQAAVERPHRLPQVGNARRQHRVPEQNQPGKAQPLHHQDRRRPAVIGDPVPGRERLGHVVGGRHAHEQEEPRAEHHDAPHLVGRRRVRAQRDEDDRPQHQQVLHGDRAIEHQRDRRRRSARPRQLQRHGAGHPEAATDQYARRDHAPRQIIEPGPAMDPRALASEREQKGRREQERGHVEGPKEPAVGGQVLEIGRVLLRRRQLQEKGREHVQRRLGGLEEAIDPEEPGPPVPAPGPQQQAGAGGVPDQLGRHEDGQLTVRAIVVAPGPRQQQQRGRHLEAGDGDERVDGVAHDRAAVEAGGRHGLRRRARRRAARQHPLDDAQVLDLRAIGARGQPGATLPLHRLVQRERVGHVAYQIVTVVGAHHSSRLPPHSASPRARRAASGICPLLTSGGAEPDSFPYGGRRRRARGRRRAGTLPAGGQRHDRAQPNDGPLERLTRGVRTREAFDGGELRVGVPQLRPADDQPTIADRQALQAVSVPPPQLILQALLILRRRILEGPQGDLPRGEAGEVQPAGGPAQLILDAVLHGAPEIGAQGADVRRFEPGEPGEGVLQHVLHQIAGRHPPGAGPLRQAAAGSPPQPGRIPLEQRGRRRGAPPLHPRQETLRGAGIRGIRSAGLGRRGGHAAPDPLTRQ